MYHTVKCISHFCLVHNRVHTYPHFSHLLSKNVQLTYVVVCERCLTPLPLLLFSGHRRVHVTLPGSSTVWRMLEWSIDIEVSCERVEFSLWANTYGGWWKEASWPACQLFPKTLWHGHRWERVTIHTPSPSPVGSIRAKVIGVKTYTHQWKLQENHCCIYSLENRLGHKLIVVNDAKVSSIEKSPPPMYQHQVLQVILDRRC